MTPSREDAGDRSRDLSRAARAERADEERLAQAGVPDAKTEEEEMVRRGVPLSSDVELVAPNEDLSQKAPDRLRSEVDEGADRRRRPFSPTEHDRDSPDPGGTGRLQREPGVVGSLDDLDERVVTELPERRALEEPLSARELTPRPDEVLEDPISEVPPEPGDRRVA